MPQVPGVQALLEEQTFLFSGTVGNETEGSTGLRREITLKAGDPIVAWKYIIHYGFYLLMIVRRSSKVVLLVDAASLKVALFHEDHTRWNPGHTLVLCSLTQNRVLVCGEYSLFELVLYSPSLVSDLLAEELSKGADGAARHPPVELAFSTTTLPDAGSVLPRTNLPSRPSHSDDGEVATRLDPVFLVTDPRSGVTQVDTSKIFPISRKDVELMSKKLDREVFFAMLRTLIDSRFDVHHPPPLSPAAVPLRLYPDFRVIVYPHIPCARSSNFALKVSRGMAYRVRLGPVGRKHLLPPAYLPVEKYSSPCEMEPVLLARGKLKSVLCADVSQEGDLVLTCTERRGKEIQVILRGVCEGK